MNIAELQKVSTWTRLPERMFIKQINESPIRIYLFIPLMAKSDFRAEISRNILVRQCHLCSDVWSRAWRSQNIEKYWKLFLIVSSAAKDLNSLGIDFRSSNLLKAFPEFSEYGKYDPILRRCVYDFHSKLCRK